MPVSSQNNIYTSPDSRLAREEEIPSVIPRECAERFLLSRKWMLRAGSVMMTLAGIQLAGLVTLAVRFGAGNRSLVWLACASALLLAVQFLLPLPALLRAAKVTAGDPDEALLESMKHLRSFWKRLVYSILVGFMLGLGVTMTGATM